MKGTTAAGLSEDRPPAPPARSAHPGLRAGRSRLSLARPMVKPARFLALACVVAACSSPFEPPAPGPPFLAIVTKVEQGTPFDSSATYVYRVRNLSVGTTPLDTVIRTTPRDTVILSLPASTYSVRLDSLPPKC